ncbi:MAG: DNA mismatch repair endonuclease MutL [Bacteroidales bacterium]|jgi:DNA mismatch repair protein MutL|nr:DNA mismatch repair endonuclease MutL [Bacteroidales bacterium]
MADVIKLLPDFVANQIAAGEVIQRPASVVKELVENSLDAGADNIKIIIKNAGRTSIQIIDNGKGMSPTDARMAFERHATSKIKSADDLFSLKTMGFRGEALASIAAVAEVELKTKRETDEIGTKIIISGSSIISQETEQCSIGTNFIIKNLFFNIPARRKFLKTDQIELKHIKTEIYRIVLTNPKIKFLVVFDDKTELQLVTENTKQRILNTFGSKLNSSLIDIETKTSIINIKGFISLPEKTKKASNEQFFFVNNRYMNHPYFRKAVLLAYDKLIKEGDNPSYFIYFDVPCEKIDINIHPTKTEIKFEDEQHIFQILQATVKQAFGKYDIVPNMYFEEDIARDAIITSSTKIIPPTQKIDFTYNPFSADNLKETYRNNGSVPKDWTALFESSKYNDEKIFQNNENQLNFGSDYINEKPYQKTNFFQLKNTYILTSSLLGLLIIHQKRAHERILYDKYLFSLQQEKNAIQQILFPLIYTPPATCLTIMPEILPQLNSLGFEISLEEKDKYKISGVPNNIGTNNPLEILENMLFVYTEYQKDMKLVINEKIALSLAKATAMKKGTQLNEQEMENLFGQLIKSSNQNYTEDGKKIIKTFSIEEIETIFK